MQPSVRNLALSLALMSALSACETASPVFDTSAIPSPPEFTEAFRKAMGAELGEGMPTILDYVRQMDGFADRIRRLIGN